MGGEVLGTAATMVVIACVLMLLAVVFGVLNFFVLLIAGIKMKYVFNIVLNVLATACWGVSAVFFAQFTTACEALGGNIITDAFGIVAMVAMTPLITIQIMGLIFAIKERKHHSSDI